MTAPQHSATQPPPKPEPNGHCRSCRAAVIWVYSERTMKAMPLDPEPSSEGNVLILNDEAAGTAKRSNGWWLARVLTAAQRFNHRTRYVSHFATCPNAAEHRKSRGRGRP